MYFKIGLFWRAPALPAPRFLHLQVSFRHQLTNREVRPSGVPLQRAEFPCPESPCKFYRRIFAIVVFVFRKMANGRPPHPGCPSCSLQALPSHCPAPRARRYSLFLSGQQLVSSQLLFFSLAFFSSFFFP